MGRWRQREASGRVHVANSRETGNASMISQDGWSGRAEKVVAGNSDEMAQKGRNSGGSTGALRLFVVMAADATQARGWALWPVGFHPSRELGPCPLFWWTSALAGCRTGYVATRGPICHLQSECVC
jgi:hypothetical protein